MPTGLSGAPGRELPLLWGSGNSRTVVEPGVPYAARPPRTLDLTEQQRLLQVTGEHARGYRDHIFFSAALGTALRLHELLALNCGDVYSEVGRARRRFPLTVFKRSNPDQEMQEAIVPDSLQYKLERYRAWKQRKGDDLGPEAPLFVSRLGRRLSARMVRVLFVKWQKAAGFERSFNVHALRHTALSNLYASTNDLRLVQRVARHKDINSTGIYLHPSDEKVLQAVRRQPC